MGAKHEDDIVQVAVRADEENALAIQCRDHKEACNQATYYRRAYARVIKRYPSAKNVEIRKEGNNVILAYTPAVSTAAWVPKHTVVDAAPTCIEERSTIDPSERERFLRLMKEDYDDGELSMTDVLVALDDADIPKEEVSWL